MKIREKKSKDQFQITNKNRIKEIKRQLKSNLRSNRIISKNLLESPQNSDDQQYQQKLLNRGSEWWNKVNHRFFRVLPQQQVEMLRQRTTSEELLSLKYPAKQLGRYFEQQITSLNPFLGSPSFLKVLFRRQVKLDRWQHYQLVTYSFKEYDYLRERAGRTAERNIHLSSFRYPMQERVDCSTMELERLELDIIDVEDNQQEIKKLLTFDVLAANSKEEVDQEIDLWENQLGAINAGNMVNWRQMVERMGHEPNIAYCEDQIASIKKELRMTEVMLYFKRGHSDKTQAMLEQALEVAMIKEMTLEQKTPKKRSTRMEKLKCLFETDCKICFCTQSDDKNQVLYCDSCNTSFHQACYGVETIKEEKFYCEACRFIKKNTVNDKDGNARTVKKPICQVCCKLNFPMRQLNGHFYHITCLVLFNLVQIKNYCIQFKPGLTHEAILQRVVQNEVNSSFCAYCHKEAGMKFKCAMEECKSFFHPICAYLHGVHFELVRSYRALNVTLTCTHHHHNRDALNQIYLRRFFCDYRGTSNRTDVQFEQQYKKEMEEKASALAAKLKEAGRGVRRSGKMSKSFKCSQLKRPRSVQKDKSQLPLSVSKRDSSEVLSNPLPPNSETDITDTRRLLRMISDRNQ